MQTYVQTNYQRIREFRVLAHCPLTRFIFLHLRPVSHNATQAQEDNELHHLLIMESLGTGLKLEQLQRKVSVEEAEDIDPNYPVDQAGISNALQGVLQEQSGHGYPRGNNKKLQSFPRMVYPFYIINTFLWFLIYFLKRLHLLHQCYIVYMFKQGFQVC